MASVTSDGHKIPRSYEQDAFCKWPGEITANRILPPPIKRVMFSFSSCVICEMSAASRQRSAGSADNSELP